MSIEVEEGNGDAQLEWKNIEMRMTQTALDPRCQGQRRAPFSRTGVSPRWRHMLPLGRCRTNGDWTRRDNRGHLKRMTPGTFKRKTKEAAGPP